MLTASAVRLRDGQNRASLYNFNAGPEDTKLNSHGCMAFVHVWSRYCSIALLQKQACGKVTPGRKQGPARSLAITSQCTVPEQIDLAMALDPVRAYQGLHNTSTMFLPLAALKYLLQR